jgi:hypothetical protein
MVHCVSCAHAYTCRQIWDSTAVVGSDRSVMLWQLGVYSGEECSMKPAVCLKDFCG